MMPTDENDPLFLGPAFDLSLQLGPAVDEARIAAAAEVVWACPMVAGPWSVSSRIGKIGPLRPDPSERGRRLNQSRFGLLTVDKAGSALPFVLSLIHDRSDWLTLAVPVAELRSRYAVNDTWVVADQPWLVSVSHVLATVADHVHHRTPIQMGVVGEEASGCWRSPHSERDEEVCPDYPPSAVLTTDVIEQRGGFVVPPKLWQQLAPRVTPVALSSGLLYAPPCPHAAMTGA